MVQANGLNGANYGAGQPFAEEQRIQLLSDASNGNVWFTGLESDPILIAYDALDPTDSLSGLHVVKYDNFAQMKAGIASETWPIPRSNSSKYESNPSFTDVTWNNTIAESEFTLYYEFQASDDAVKLGKGIHGKDGSWQAFETNVDALYQNEDL